jgi:hypothetical protein
MTVHKKEVLELINELPEKIDIDDIIYRLYLKQKLESAEKDIKYGRTLTHKEVVKETAKWFKK